MSLLAPIPTERQGAARAALATAFGATPVTALAPVTGGASGALTYRVEAGGRPYLMRIETRRDAFRNPHQYACMQIAAEAGLAPPVRHVDGAAGVVIMDFLPSRPLSEYPGGPAALANAMGGMISRLQATPAFPVLRDYPVVLQTLMGFLGGSALFAPGLLEPHREGLARIVEAYPWNNDARVSSHVDPNPRNIIFDGQRLWLIDWETACRNDPLVDLAVLTHEIAPTPELETALLTAWQGRAPDRALTARVALMRRLTFLFYGGIVLSGFAATPRPAPDAELTAMSWPEFAAAVGEGRLTLGSPEAMYAFGKIFLASFLASVSGPCFAEDLAIARAG